MLSSGLTSSVNFSMVRKLGCDSPGAVGMDAGTLHIARFSGVCMNEPVAWAGAVRCYSDNKSCDGSLHKLPSIPLTFT